MTRKVVEREITAPVELCLPNGRLNPDAVGWTRSQLHNTDRIGRGFYGWGRNKRWEYWCVTTPMHILALTVSSLDYAAVHEVWVFDRATETPYGYSAVSPLRHRQHSRNSGCRALSRIRRRYRHRDRRSDSFSTR